MQKKAFTVVEVIICVLIIGVLTVITLNVSTNNSANQYAKLYNVAYDSLVQAVGNAYLEWSPDETDANLCLTNGWQYYWSKNCWKYYTATHEEQTYDKKTRNTYVRFEDRNIILKDPNGQTDESKYYGGILNYPRRYPGFLMGRQHDEKDYMGGRYDGWGTDTAFCRDIVKYFNTLATDYECQSFITAIKKEGKKPAKPLEAGSFHDVFCAGIPPEGGQEPSGNCFDTSDNKLVPSFTTSNGQKFYISGLFYTNIPFFGEKDEEKQERRAFRFIAVDLNGDSKPNRQYSIGAKFPWTATAGSTEKDSGSYPDIVLFAITDNGNVVPLGLPEFSTVYATAKVYFPEYLNEKVVQDGIERFKKNTMETSTTMNLFDAKLTAWGSSAANDPNLVCGQPLSENNPMTYSELFYWIALNCNEKGCNNKTEYEVCRSATSSENTPLYADAMMANLVRQFIYKEKGKTVFDSLDNTFIPTIINNSLLDEDHGCASYSSKCKVQIENQ